MRRPFCDFVVEPPQDQTLLSELFNRRDGVRVPVLGRDETLLHSANSFAARLDPSYCSSLKGLGRCRY